MQPFIGSTSIERQGDFYDDGNSSYHDWIADFYNIIIAMWSQAVILRSVINNLCTDTWKSLIFSGYIILSTDLL